MMRIRWSLLIGMALLLTACVGGRGTPATPPTTSPFPPTALPTPTSAPTRTPTPQPEPLVLVLAPEEADPILRQTVVAWARDRAQALGWKFDQQPAWEGALPGLRWALVLPPADPLPIVQEAPEAAVLTLSPLPEGASSQMFAVDLSPYTPEVLAFAAGYLAALMTPDYRVGAVIGNGEQAPALEQAFAQGVAYYCGLCRPAFPPFTAYPVSVPVPRDAAPETWWLGVQALVTQYEVERVYLTDPTVAQVLAEREDGPALLWSTSAVGVTPPYPHLVLGPDVTAALDAWAEAWTTGRAPQQRTWVPPWGVRGEALSPGKRLWAEEVLQGMLSGRIVP